MAQTIESCIEAFLANSILDGENSLVRSACVRTYTLHCVCTRAAPRSRTTRLIAGRTAFSTSSPLVRIKHTRTRAASVRLSLLRIDVQQVSAAHRLRQVHLHPNIPSHSHPPYALGSRARPLLMPRLCLCLKLYTYNTPYTSSSSAASARSHVNVITRIESRSCRPQALRAHCFRRGHAQTQHED